MRLVYRTARSEWQGRTNFAISNQIQLAIQFKGCTHSCHEHTSCGLSRCIVAKSGLEKYHCVTPGTNGFGTHCQRNVCGIVKNRLADACAIARYAWIKAPGTGHDLVQLSGHVDRDNRSVRVRGSCLRGYEVGKFEGLAA
jgi:hypothetical protein